MKPISEKDQEKYRTTYKMDKYKQLTMELIVLVVSILSVCAFGIASGTLAYNVHEFRIISKIIQEGNKRLSEDHMHMVRVLEGIEKRLSGK